MNKPQLKLYAVSIVYFKEGKVENQILFRPCYTNEEALGYGMLKHQELFPKNQLNGVWVDSAPLEGWTPPQ